MPIPAGYRETLASARSIRAVETFWSFRASGKGATLVLPDARCDIILRQCGQTGALTPGITGPATTASTIPHEPGDAWIGARLRPQMGAALWGTEMPRAADRTLRGPDALELCPQLCAVKQLDEPALSNLVTELTSAYLPDARLTRALDALHTSGGRLSQASLASLSGCSPRHLLRLFMQETGLSPKTHGQIIRFHRALRLANDHRLPLTAAAFECGYADHAHLTRDCRRFGGFVPSKQPDTLTLPGLPG